jgi:hypothetical protein
MYLSTYYIYIYILTTHTSSIHIYKNEYIYSISKSIR